VRISKSNFEPSFFERRLQGRRMPDPSPGLQATIMQAVTRELSRPSLPKNRGGGPHPFAAAIAAVLMIGSNLALTAGPTISLNAAPKLTQRQTLAGANDLTKLDIDLSKDDATRIFLVLQAGGNVSRLPELRAGAIPDIGQRTKAELGGTLQ
jgi:hypothetical protein